MNVHADNRRKDNDKIERGLNVFLKEKRRGKIEGKKQEKIDEKMRENGGENKGENIGREKFKK